MTKFYIPKYKITQTKAEKKLTEIYSGQISFPKWIVFVGAILLLASAAICVASIVISINKQPNEIK
ncbi:hypothetical protein BpHYR1_021956 [Brachionus plicatilis]|uniref:Uncharacterized protein n=1 Tax=Brachionus plicatilis TaxID=10195 RepID=A0A3M7PM93_BRAPC|nr:hypothetical protein BpHYR1_021956 [Brachionus plicatilis]